MRRLRQGINYCSSTVSKANYSASSDGNSRRIHEQLFFWMGGKGVEGMKGGGGFKRPLDNLVEKEGGVNVKPLVVGGGGAHQLIEQQDG